MRWQDINKKVYFYAGGTTGVFVLIWMFIALVGVNYDYTNWEQCVQGRECYARFDVKTTYWRICLNIDDSATVPQFFKKQSRSRTLWLNTSRYGLVTTTPTIKTELMFGTYKSRGIDTAPDNKPLREVQTGDCIERGQTNYLYVRGLKEPEQEIIWKADLFDIDPIWISYPAGNLTVNINSDLNESQLISAQFAPDFSIPFDQLNWSNHTILLGNFSWNFSETNISVKPTVDWMYNMSNNGTINFTVTARLNQTADHFRVHCDSQIVNNYIIQKNVSIAWTTLFNLSNSTSRTINCTMDLLNYSQVYINWTLEYSTPSWDFNLTFNVTSP